MSTASTIADYIRHNQWPQSLQQLLQADNKGQAILEDQDALRDPWGGTYQYDPSGPRNGGRRPDIWAVDPKDGEIAVAVVRRGLSPYAELTAIEKTPAPVDFVATGLIGDIKIDEVVVCGRLDAPTIGRIASGAWRVSLSRFTVHPEGDAKPAVVGDLGCPR